MIQLLPLSTKTSSYWLTYWLLVSTRAMEGISQDCLTCLLKRCHLTEWERTKGKENFKLVLKV